MATQSESLRELILRFIAESPQGRSALDIVKIISKKENVSPELVRRELLNLLERGEVALRMNLKLEKAEREGLVDHHAQ